MYQQTTIVGNVGRAPELRYLPDGTAVADFSVAVNRKWTGADGQQNEKVTWFRVTCWRKLAETVNQYVTKGRQVLVVGEVELDLWEGKAGEPRGELVLNANTVKFLGQRNGDAPGEDDDAGSTIPF
jgi:single-strand DNA-binding protein